MDRFGIYIHIPFCKKKCNYCDFISFSCAQNIIEEYFNCLISEIEITNINKKINTIYIGGGTPSYVDSKFIVEIVNKIKNKFKVDENCEITIEINPGTITKEKLLDYKQSGINRISIGLQSSNNIILKTIGRIHSFEDFIDTYNLVKEIGFKNINVDLMLALPTQTEDDLVESLDKVIKLSPQHISIYSLIIEEGTPIQKMIENKQIDLVREDIERRMYWKANEILEHKGYKHYEISNYSKKGYESKHNLDCWNQEQYIGFGVAAHSYINCKRFNNINNIEQYINNIKNKDFEKNIEINEIQTKELQEKEYMILGLRKIEGVSISEFERKFRINPLFYFRFEISNLTNKGLIEIDLDKIRLTKRGLDFANIVFEEFI